jgi:hypothetical protein
MPNSDYIGSSRWQVHWWLTCGKDCKAIRFSDRQAALFWLRQFRSDFMAMARLRSLVTEHAGGKASLWRQGDDGLFGELAWFLQRGDLHVHRVPMPTLGANRGQIATSAPVPPPAPARAPASPRGIAPAKAPDDPATFSDRADAAAQAAVLRGAAASGLPFCEECARAAAAAREAA